MDGLSKTEARASLLYNPSYSSERPSSPYMPYAEGGYHQREGFATTGTIPVAQSKKPTWLYIPNSKWTWTFLLIIIFQAAIGLALEGYIFAQFQLEIEELPTQTPQQATASSPYRHSIPTYLSLYIFGFLYQLVLTVDALRLKNTIQIIGLVGLNIGLLVQSAVQIDQIRDALDNIENPPGSPATDSQSPTSLPNTRAFLVAVPCVLALGTVFLGLVTWKLNTEFSWSIYKNISADLRLKRRYLSYQIYIALLKFDFFFFLAFTVQFLVIVTDDTTMAEKVLTIIAIPVTILILTFAAYCTLKENRVGMFIILFFWFAGLAYFLFKLFRMWLGPSGPGSRIGNYLPTRNSLTTFAIITIVLLLVTIVYCCICTANFGKGLKPHLVADRQRRRGASTDLDNLYPQRMPLAGAGPSRMTID